MALRGTDFGPVSGRRVLVTGGCGFIGSEIVRQLVRRNCTVTVLDDLSAGSRDATAGLDGVDFVRGTVLDARTVRRAARNCNLVIHLAGIVGKMLVSKDPAHVYRVSVDGTRNVLSKSSCASVVVFSSSAVYGVEGPVPVSECEQLDDIRAAAYDGGHHGYAVGKLHMEGLAREASRRGRKVLVIRPFNVMGPGQTGRYGMVIPRFVADALQGRPLTIYGDGSQTRSFGHVHTFVETLMRVIECRAAWEPGSNAINIGNPRETTIFELAQRVIRQTKSTSLIRFVPYDQVFPGQRDVRARVPDVRRLQGLIGRVSWPSLARIIRDVSALYAEVDTRLQPPKPHRAGVAVV